MIPTTIDGTDITGATIDGTDVQEITVDGQTVFNAFPGPDPNIYLQDDFGDNKLSSRDNSGTTTYNGVTGVFRPEYTVPSGKSSPSVSSQTLNVEGGEAITTTINLNLSQTVTWEWTDVENSTGDRTALHCFAEQATSFSKDQLHSSYYVDVRNGNNLRLNITQSGGSSGVIINGSTFSGKNDVKVTRTSAGVWELFLNNTSQGTTTDTTFTSPSHTAFAARDSSDTDVAEIKVF